MATTPSPEMTGTNGAEEGAGPAAPFDLLTHVFGDSEMAGIFSVDSLVASWLEAEAALALAEADAGILDPEVAAAVAGAASPGNVDKAALWEGTRLVGFPILPLVRMIAAALPEGPNGRVHFGATTQDIMDTGLALQLTRALGRLETLLGGLGDELARLTRRHRGTTMAARTHGQQAVPTTFGAKLASLLGELARHRQRLGETRQRIGVVSLYGAGGTSAALGGEVAGQVREAFARRLRLAVAPTPWHVARDSVAEVGMVAALVSATAARFANEVVNLSRTEIAEVSEGGGHDYGASSTMPHKHNPVRSEVVIGMAIAAGAAASGLPRTMVVAHERAAGEWQAEWSLLPYVMSSAAGALSNARQVARTLAVDADRMRANMESDGGGMLAEAFMIGLSASMGREAAHDLVYAAARQTLEAGSLLDALRRVVPAEQADLLEQVAGRTSYEQYLGEATALCDRAIALWNDGAVDRSLG